MKRSKRELERTVDDLESGDGDVLGSEDMWEWIRDLKRQGDDIERPPDYFGHDAEWADGLVELHEKLSDRHPELEHLTPPEAHILSYMPGEFVETLLELLYSSYDSDADVQAFWEHLQELQEPDES
jgi:hypothetical protein